jgi:hypothetical protein
MSSIANPALTLERTTMRRVTWRIVPFLMVCYFIAFVDRVNAGFAALHESGHRPDGGDVRSRWRAFLHQLRDLRSAE